MKEKKYMLRKRPLVPNSAELTGLYRASYGERIGDKCEIVVLLDEDDEF